MRRSRRASTLAHCSLADSWDARIDAAPFHPRPSLFVARSRSSGFVLKVSFAHRKHGMWQRTNRTNATQPAGEKLPRGIVIQPRSEPALGFGERNPFAL